MTQFHFCYHKKSELEKSEVQEWFRHFLLLPCFLTPTLFSLYLLQKVWLYIWSGRLPVCGIACVFRERKRPDFCWISWVYLYLNRSHCCHFEQCTSPKMTYKVSAVCVWVSCKKQRGGEGDDLLIVTLATVHTHICTEWFSSSEMDVAVKHITRHLWHSQTHTGLPWACSCAEVS